MIEPGVWVMIALSGFGVVLLACLRKPRSTSDRTGGEAALSSREGDKRSAERTSLVCGIPGIIVQTGGWLLIAMSSDQHGDLLRSLDRPGAWFGTPANPTLHTVGVLLAFVGTVLLLVGAAYYAMARGRSPVWCLLIFLSLPGLIVLACLEDRLPDPSRMPAKGPSFFGGFFALMSILCLPLFPIAFVFGVVGLALNRRLSGWAWYLSIVGTCLSPIVLVLVIIAISLQEPSDKKGGAGRPIRQFPQKLDVIDKADRGEPTRHEKVKKD